MRATSGTKVAGRLVPRIRAAERVLTVRVLATVRRGRVGERGARSGRLLLLLLGLGLLLLLLGVLMG